MRENEHTQSSKVANRSLMEILKADIDFSRMPWHVLFAACLTMTINQKYTNSKYESCYENIMKKVMTRGPNYVTATFNR